jgi:predicted metal-dependent hydrolase
MHGKPDIEVVRSKRKTLALEVTDTARIVVRAPYRLSVRAIDAFVETHTEWLVKKHAQAQKRLAYQSPRAYVTGEWLPYLGVSYPLQTMTRRGTTFQKNILAPKKGTRTSLEKWYRRAAREFFERRLACMAAEMDVEYTKLRITSARTRWGSCSSKGAINLSWRLVMAPVYVVDYVVVHELAHLRHMNHSRRFWLYVEKYHPNYRDAQAWLSLYGSFLQL